MRYKLLIFNAESNTMYDYAPVTEKIIYTTNRKGSVGKLTFSFIKKNLINLTEGAKVQFYDDGAEVFLGFVFATEQDRWGIVSVTAYDQLRYLKSNASYSIEGKKLGEIIQQIATDMQLQVGNLEDTGYVIKTLTKVNTECLDIIEYGLGLTQNNTGKTFVFYDNFGKLYLTEAKNLMSDILIGNGSIITDYTYKSDIDSDTYNQVKFVRSNKKNGQEDTYIFSDSNTINKWGLLRKYVNVDENLNEAQINQQGNTMMAYYDRVLKTISIDGVGGSPGLKAGAMAKLKIKDVPELSGGIFLLLDKVKHTFSNGEHSMSLEAKIKTL